MTLLLSPCCSPLIILGVTNPFFTKTLEHWPHIVRIGEASAKGHGKYTVIVAANSNLSRMEFYCILIDSSTKVYRRSTSTGSKFDVMDMKPGERDTLLL